MPRCSVYISPVDRQFSNYSLYQAVHEETTQQQESFDHLAEQAQVLMQSSTDGRVSTQLTQLSSRYSALITLSKVVIMLYIIDIKNN